MNVEQLKRLNLIKSLVEEQGADGDKRWLIAQLEAEAAEVERLMVPGVRYSDERIAAEARIRELEGRVRLYEPALWWDGKTWTDLGSNVPSTEAKEEV